jgi:hypothetical protein
MSPWNYPLNLALVPLGGALSAGCSVYVKLSRHSPHTSAALAKVLREALDGEAVIVEYEGGAEKVCSCFVIGFCELFILCFLSLTDQIAFASSLESYFLHWQCRCGKDCCGCCRQTSHKLHTGAWYIILFVCLYCLFLYWIGLDWIRLDWIGLDWIGFYSCIVLCSIVLYCLFVHLSLIQPGGKNPAIVFADANIDLAAKRLAWAKTFNAGQTCIAPDYAICVGKGTAEAFIEA